MNKSKKSYWVHQGNNDICVLCKHKLKSCVLGQYCSNPRCGYVDGMVELTLEQVKKFKKFIIE